MSGDTKRYGPVEWSSDVLERAHDCPTDNNDDPVTEEMVNGWLSFFSKHVEGFRQSHKAVLARIKGTG